MENPTISPPPVATPPIPTATETKALAPTPAPVTPVPAAVTPAPVPVPTPLVGSSTPPTNILDALSEKPKAEEKVEEKKEDGGGSNKLLMVGGVIVLILAAVAGGYFFMSSKDAEDNSAGTSNQPVLTEEEQDAILLEELNEGLADLDDEVIEDSTITSDTSAATAPPTESEYDFSGEGLSFYLPTPSWDVRTPKEQGEITRVESTVPDCRAISIRNPLLGGKTLEQQALADMGVPSLDPNTKDMFTVDGKETITFGPMGIGDVYTVYVKSGNTYFKFAYSQFVPEGGGDDTYFTCNDTYPEGDFVTFLAGVKIQ